MDETFEQRKTCYEQNCQQFRSLNQIMWQVPIIAMTLTGGLWFGVTKVDAISGFQYALLGLAFFANLGFIIVLNRTRYVMGQYLDKIKTFHEDAFVEAPGNSMFTTSKSVMRTFQFLLLLSALASATALGLMLKFPPQPDAPSGQRVIIESYE